MARKLIHVGAKNHSACETQPSLSRARREIQFLPVIVEIFNSTSQCLDFTSFYFFLPMEDINVDATVVNSGSIPMRRNSGIIPADVTNRFCRGKFALRQGYLLAVVLSPRELDKLRARRMERGE